MKQTCGSVREWLGAFADGELDPERAEQVRVHLETCADCRRELDQIVALGRLAKSVKHPQLAEDYWDWHRDRVWRRITLADRRQAPSRRPTLAWARLIMPAVSAAVLVFVVFAGWRMLGEKSFFSGKGMVAERGLRQEPAPAPVVAREEGGPVARAKPASKGAAAGENQTQLIVTGRGTEKTEVGYAAKGGGSAGAEPISPPARAAERGAAAEPKIAADELNKALASAPPASGTVRTSSKRGRRIVSGPVLLESPPVADADVTDTGTVLLSVKTDSTGRVLSAAVRRSSGSPKLDSLAVRQTRQSRFKAAVKNNRSVSSTFEYPFRVQKKQARQPEQPKPKTEQRPQEVQKPQEVQRPQEVQKPQERQNQPASDDKSQKPDSGNKDAPLKEKTKK